MKNYKTIVIMSVAILLILTVGESIKFPVSVHAITFGNMHGNVIDENNNALQEVKVVLYSSSGVLIGSQYTDENGFFRIALGSGSWKISLKKDGYVNVEISFTMPLAGFTDDPQNDPVNLEDIILKKALRLTASVLTRVENPGDIVLFPFTISNIGDQPEEVNFLTQNSAGWATRILDQSGEIKKALLTSGGMNLNLEVSIPSTASGNSTVSLTVLGRTSSTLNFTVVVEARHEIKMTSTFPYMSSEIGKSIEYPFTIANTGEMDETVDLIGVIPEGWVIKFITAEKTDVLQIFLKAGQSEKLTVEVTPSTDAVIGIYKMPIKAISERDELMATLNFTVVMEARHEIEMTSTFPYLSSKIGDSIDYPLSITNTGEMNETLNLMGVIPHGWAIRFITAEKTDVLQIFLKAGQSEKLTVEVTPSTDAVIGIYNMSIIAISERDELRATLNLRASLRKVTENIEVVSTFREITIEAGKILQYPIKILNKGDKDIFTFLNVLSIPNNWKAAIKSGDVEVSQVLVEAGQTMSLILQVTPPSVVETGSYKITFDAVTEDGTVLKHIELGANIMGSYKLEAVLSTLYTTVATGGSTSFTVKVTNSGQSLVTALNLKVDAPSGWDVSVTPLKVNSVASTDSSTFTVITQIPGDTVAGDYMITLRAQSDQVNSGDVQLRVTTSAPTSWGLIGVGIALVVIVALAVMFRRFSRR